jgi:hypothetical protein
MIAGNAGAGGDAHPLGSAENKDRLSQLYGLLAQQEHMIRVTCLPFRLRLKQPGVLPCRVPELPPNLHNKPSM